MKRAKFKNPQKQREFFIDVKKKLGIGSKKLSKRLNLKSRGALESYTLMRTSPPVEVIKKLEKLSHIKANYEEVDGKVYRKKRKFMSLKPKDAEKILRNKFEKDFLYISNLVKKGNSIKDIIYRIRKKGYSFDNSLISRCIGTYKTNFLSKIVPIITPNKEEILIKGNIRKDKNTLSINFNLMPLYKILKQKPIKVGLEISENRRIIRIFPIDSGRKLIPSNKAIKILLTEKSGLEVKSKIEIIFNPKKFGLSINESIYDSDAKELAKEALKRGFILDNYRSTPSNHKGDLSLFINNKNIVIEITKATSYKGSYFKIGQCFIQKTSWPRAIHYLICKKGFLSKDAEKALKRINTKILYTSFNKYWEKEIINMIKNEI